MCVLSSLSSVMTQNEKVTSPVCGWTHEWKDDPGSFSINLITKSLTNRRNKKAEQGVTPNGSNAPCCGSMAFSVSP
jgi:hypothetical protein